MNVKSKKVLVSTKSVLWKGQTYFENKTTKKEMVREQNNVFPFLKLSRLLSKIIAFIQVCFPSYESALFQRLKQNDSYTNRNISESNTEALATT